MDFARKACGLGDQYRQRSDCQIHARSHIEELLIFRPWLLGPQREDTSLAQIIHMQEFPHGSACAPASHAGVTALGRFMETADQGRQHVAVGGVIVVARPIEIWWASG